MLLFILDHLMQCFFYMTAFIKDEKEPPEDERVCPTIYRVGRTTGREFPLPKKLFRGNIFCGNTARLDV